VNFIHLKGHAAEVFRCTWNPANHNQLASGAGDGTVRIWTLGKDNDKLESMKSSSDVSNYPKKIMQVMTLAHFDSRISNEDAIAGNSTTVDVTTMNWSKDGKLLCTGDVQGNTRVYTNDGDLIKVLHKHKGTVFAAKFSPDGKKLLTAGYDQKLILWNVAKLLAAYQSNPQLDSYSGKNLGDMVDSGGLSLSKSASKDFIAHEFSVHVAHVLDVSWRDNFVFASCSSDKNVVVCDIRETNSENISKVLQGHQGEVNHVRWSPNGKYLASASDDNSIIIWEYNSEITSKNISDRLKRLHTLKGHSGEISCIRWAPNSTKLASVSSDSSTRLWDATSGASLHVLRKHKARVYSASFFINNSFLATGSVDNNVLIHHVENGELYKKIKLSGNVFEVAFNRKNTRRIAAGCGLPENEICLIDF